MATQDNQRTAEERDVVVLRFAGDSGDGMQLVGDLFTTTSAMMGDQVATLPDYPAEIRAPAGTVAGVSGFQVCFGSDGIFTPGDDLDVLVAMNPAALKTNLPMVKEGGVIIVNDDAFVQKNLDKAEYSENPLLGEGLKKYHVVRASMTKLSQAALAGSTLSPKQVDQCKNFFALGFTYWLFNRTNEHTLTWLKKKFQYKPAVMEGNIKVLEAGRQLGETGGVFPTSYVIRKKQRAVHSGKYRHVTGNTAAALGLIAASRASGLKLFLGSYPITPATDILHELSKHKQYVTVFQAEDEIAACGAAIGASFAGSLAATTTSGPGFSLKSEFINLAVIVELPLIIVNVQRVGPSTGLPTKSEQSDLFQSLWGRHGESPIVVMAADSPKDCFDIMIEAARVALKYMTPVIVLSDGYLGNGAEVWRIPESQDLPVLKAPIQEAQTEYQPYARNPETLARYWAAVGTPGLEHRIGGLEKEDKSGKVSHSPLNHEKMVHLRAEKIARVAQDIPPIQVHGNQKAKLLVLGWGSTYGVIREAVEKLNREGVSVACAHLRYLNPFPRDLKDLLGRYEKVLVPENNTGQLWYKLRGDYLVNTEKFNKVQGQPFRVDEIEGKIKSMLGVGK